jgi:hypothetical protein
MSDASDADAQDLHDSDGNVVGSIKKISDDGGNGSPIHKVTLRGKAYITHWDGTGRDQEGDLNEAVDDPTEQQDQEHENNSQPYDPSDSTEVMEAKLRKKYNY